MFKKNSLIKIIFFSFFSVLSYLSNAQNVEIKYKTDISVDELVNTLKKDGIKITNPKLRLHREEQVGTFYTNKIGEVLKIEGGVVFSTGTVAGSIIGGEKEDSDTSDDNKNIILLQEKNEDIDLSNIEPQAKYDQVIFEFDLEVNKNYKGLMLEYQFASDEYPEFVGSKFNDVFGYFISDPNNQDDNIPNGDINKDGKYDEKEEKALNFATIKKGDRDIPVSINTINIGEHGSNGQANKPGLDLTNKDYYIDNLNNGKKEINHDGLTTKLVALSKLKLGVLYHVRIVISDSSDKNYNSAVFISYLAGLPVITLEDDFGEISSKGGKVIDNVLKNDKVGNILNPNLTSKELIQVSTSNNKIKLNPETGAIHVSEGLPKGEYTLVYKVCKPLGLNCEEAKAIIKIVNNPELGSIKESGVPVLNSDGSYDVSYNIHVKNTGDVVLRELSIIDDLKSESNLGSSFISIEEQPVVSIIKDTSGKVVVPTGNALYSGVGDLLTGTDGELYPGDIIGIRFTVRVNPHAEGAPTSLGNIATVSGKDPSGKKVKDKTNSKGTPDDNPGEEDGEKTPTRFPAYNSGISLIKSAKTIDVDKNGVVNIGDKIAYTFMVKNTGDVNLTNLRIEDALLAEVKTQTLSELKVGQTDVSTFNGFYTITKKDIEKGGVNNTAVVYGEDPSKQLVKDVSDAGTDSEAKEIKDPEKQETLGSEDKNSDGDPTNDPTFIAIDNTIDLGITKEVSEITPSVNGEIIFTIKVTNHSLSLAKNVQISEVLQSGFSLVSFKESKGVYKDSEWIIDVLEAKSSATLTLKVKVNAQGEYFNTVTIENFEGGKDLNKDNDTAKVELAPKCLIVYNVMSPNQDGDNDTFIIDCIENYPKSTVEIFNRWGNAVYKANNYQNNWKGRCNVSGGVISVGSKVPAGIYFYVIDLKDGTAVKKGWLQIVY